MLHHGTIKIVFILHTYLLDEWTKIKKLILFCTVLDLQQYSVCRKSFHLILQGIQPESKH